MLKYIKSKMGIKSLLILFMVSFMSIPAQATAVFWGGASGIGVYNLPDNTMSIRVSGPDGIYFESESANLKPEDFFVDGTYSYEIYAKANSSESTKQSLNTGRENNSTQLGYAIQIVESGYFRIFNGSVVMDEEEE